MITRAAVAGGKSRPSGQASMQVTRRLGPLTLVPPPAIRASWQWRLKNWILHRSRALPALITYRILGHVFGLVWMESTLSAKVIKANGQVIDYGVISHRVVTNTGVGFIVDAFQNLVELENMKYHGIGTGAVAEAVGDTALGTELTTVYNPDNTRATGSTTEQAANIYRTVGTNTVDGSAAVTEHGILSQAATGGGVLLDRSVFSAINLATGDSLQTTYDLTLTAGG
jgi:hypothetical protein